jgi:hypothetical protein
MQTERQKLAWPFYQQTATLHRLWMNHSITEDALEWRRYPTWVFLLNLGDFKPGAKASESRAPDRGTPSMSSFSSLCGFVPS